jgi:quercetin dioxygenase-like cupin family protein
MTSQSDQHTLPYGRTAAGDASRWYIGHLFTFLAQSQDTSGQLAVFDTLIRRGLEPPPHTHSREDEAYLVLDGHLTFIVGGQTIEAGPNTFVWLPRDLQHSFACDTEQSRAIILLTPAGLEAAFQELSEPAARPELPPVPAGPPDVERLLRTFGQYGVTFAAPPAS